MCVLQDQTSASAFKIALLTLSSLLPVKHRQKRKVAYDASIRDHAIVMDCLQSLSGKVLRGAKGWVWCQHVTLWKLQGVYSNQSSLKFGENALVAPDTRDNLMSVAAYCMSRLLSRSLQLRRRDDGLRRMEAEL